MKNHYCEKIKKCGLEIDEPENKVLDTLTDVCIGNSEMILETHFVGTNGLEDREEQCIETIVNYCPFCGLKSSPE